MKSKKLKREFKPIVEIEGVYIKTWYLEPLSDSFKNKIDKVLKAVINAYANLKNNDRANTYGLKENVVCRDGTYLDLYLVDIDILTKIYETGHIEGYRIWCSRGGGRVVNVTDQIDVFIAPKISDIPWIKEPKIRDYSLVY